MPFLNFFAARIEPLPARTRGEYLPPDENDASTHWSEDAAKLGAVMGSTDADGYTRLWDALYKEGFTWLSKCQGEWNVIHAVDTPIVFRKLDVDGAQRGAPPLTRRHAHVGWRLHDAARRDAAARAPVRRRHTRARLTPATRATSTTPPPSRCSGGCAAKTRTARTASSPHTSCCSSSPMGSILPTHPHTLPLTAPAPALLLGRAALTTSIGSIRAMTVRKRRRQLLAWRGC